MIHTLAHDMTPFLSRHQQCWIKAEASPATLVNQPVDQQILMHSSVIAIPKRYISFVFNFRVGQLNLALPSAYCLCTTLAAQTVSSSATTPILPCSSMPSSVRLESDPRNRNDDGSPDIRNEQQRESRRPGRGRGRRRTDRGGFHGRGRGRGRGRGSGVSQVQNSEASTVPQHPRLFLGIELPQETREVLTTLGTEHLPMTRTLPVSSYHITLHFLGTTDFQKLKSLLDELVNAKQTMIPRAFAVRIRGVGAFPEATNGDSARVLWAGLEQPCIELQQLYQLLKEGLNVGGYKVEDRPYIPHITIAKRNIRSRRREQAQQQQQQQQEHGEQQQMRCRDNSDNDNGDGDELDCEIVETTPATETNSVSRWVEQYKEFDCGRVDVNDFVIYESILGRGEPIYEVRCRYNLTNTVNQEPSSS